MTNLKALPNDLLQWIMNFLKKKDDILSLLLVCKTFRKAIKEIKDDYFKSNLLVKFRITNFPSFSMTLPIDGCSTLHHDIPQDKHPGLLSFLERRNQGQISIYHPEVEPLHLSDLKDWIVTFNSRLFRITSGESQSIHPKPEQTPEAMICYTPESPSPEDVLSLTLRHCKQKKSNVGYAYYVRGPVTASEFLAILKKIQLS